MAAIIPFLEHQADPAETDQQREVLALPPETSAAAGTVDDELGLGRVTEVQQSWDPSGITVDGLSQAHAGLVQTAWIRASVEQALVGNAYRVVADGRDVHLVLERPIAITEDPSDTRFPVAPWSPAASPNARKFSVLSWTSKMGAPSFSLPAGPVVAGGSCPGANAGQSIVPIQTLRASARSIAEVIHKPVRLQQAICQYCVAGDTRVMVRGRGLVRIDALVGLDEFAVWDGAEWCTTRVVEQGVRALFELETTHGHSLNLTADHKVLTRDRGMVEVQDLEADDVLVSGIGDSTAFPATRPLPPYAVSDHPAALKTEPLRVWSYDVGLALGLVFGDGTCYERKSDGRLVVHLSKGEADGDCVDWFATWVRSWTSTKSAPRTFTPSPGPMCANPQPTRTYAVTINAVEELFRAVGMVEAKANHAMPAAIWSASDAGVRGFLAGLFQTDGCISISDRRAQISLAQTSEQFLRDVQLLLQAYGVRSTVCEYRATNEGRAEHGYRKLFKLEVSAADSVKQLGRLLKLPGARKQALLDQAVATVEAVASRRTYPRVLSVRALNKYEPVYDLLNVGRDHMFTANGLQVSNCYAEGGQYSTGQVQFAQVLRFIWCRDALRVGDRMWSPFDGTEPPPTVHAWLDAMSYAIENADYLNSGGHRGKIDYPPERHPGRYFRIHDSGDFWGPGYLWLWKQIANRFADITFWAPSRYWAVSRQAIDHVNQINNPPGNLIIRPSAYHVNEAPPRDLGPGWASGSTAFALDQKPAGVEAGDFSWDCQTYAVEDEKHTCRHALAPDGEVGCRACWRHPDREVNYTLH